MHLQALKQVIDQSDQRRATTCQARSSYTFMLPAIRTGIATLMSNETLFERSVSSRFDLRTSLTISVSSAITLLHRTNHVKIAV